jgi:hypothetical protein
MRLNRQIIFLFFYRQSSRYRQPIVNRQSSIVNRQSSSQRILGNRCPGKWTMSKKGSIQCPKYWTYTILHKFCIFFGLVGANLRNIFIFVY